MPEDAPDLPEYRVTFEEVTPDEPASALSYPDNLGSRTKLGGKPHEVEKKNYPTCPQCKQSMSFVAQIDSIHHFWPTNPTSKPLTEQSFMFGDVGMIYVWFCFDCLEAKATFACF